MINPQQPQSKLEERACRGTGFRVPHNLPIIQIIVALAALTAK